ncbi:3'-5' exonuclease [Candidatus Wolfebacteria bacterium]|nr:3'-5' exonuclease [Candidatus Wolfebacteria bacterium]
MNNVPNLKDFDLGFIDAEMTGLNFNCELTEIAVIRASGFNFSVLDEWQTKIKPWTMENAEEEALKITGYNEKDWADALDEETALKIFLEKVDKTILVGQNINFDLLFIHKALTRHNLKPTFWYKTLDTFTLGWEKLRNKPNARNLSLHEMANYFNIDQGKAHSALDDIRATYKVFLKLVNELH